MPKILILNGSPRRNGNTATLVAQVAEGARERGAEVESFYLHGMDIQPCDACDACQENADLDCIIDDDMQLLYPKLRAADAIVYASPVYWFTLSAQIKLFMDRCYGMVADGVYALAGKRIGIVLVYGGEDPFDSGAINALRTYQDAFGYIGAQIVGIVYGSANDAGAILKNEAVMERAHELGRKLAGAA